ncbi:MAG: hypothetical protein COB36_03545 [Alphaproteobacteria bacterium]|nr:MAG: hypothetical protein COB36_03545 [Alphaproteobacteria bacterium]
MIRIKILKKSFVILSLLLVFSVGSVISHSAHAQVFNSGKKKTTNVYNPIPRNQPQPQQNSGHKKNATPSEAETKTAAKPASEAQTAALPKLNSVVSGHVKAVTSSCINKWEEQACMKALASLNVTLASTYAEALNNANKKSYMGGVKNHCAASTAALQVSVPAYAMRSAMTECINAMTTISQQTSVFPDPSLTQLAVSAVLCIGKNKSCGEIEHGLVAAAQR